MTGKLGLVFRGVPLNQSASTACTEDAPTHSPLPLHKIMPEDVVKPNGCDLQTHCKADILKGDNFVIIL